MSNCFQSVKYIAGVVDIVALVYPMYRNVMNFEILKNNKFKVHRFDLGIVLMKENYYIVNNYSVNSAQVFGFCLLD